MWNAVKEILASKKALAAIVAILVWVVGKAGLDLDAADLAPIVAVLMTYILGQGLADKGKEAAKVIDKGIGTSPDPQ